MNKITSKQTGNSVLSGPQSIATFGLAVVWMVAVIISWMLGLSTPLIIVIMAGMGGSMAVIFFVYVLDQSKFDETLTHFKYLTRKRKGKTSIEGFTFPLDKLRKYIPIKRVLEDGLIEYGKKQYGVAIRYDPAQVPRSELGDFHTKMEHIANSFGPGIEASFHFYNMIDRTNPLADTLLRSINTKGKTLEQKKHLHGLYEEATKNDQPFVDTPFLLAIKLGKFNNVDLANVAYRSIVPGVLKSMQERGIYAIQLVGESEIAIEFRQFAVMEKYT